MHTPGQWPDNIVSGEIRYGRASNYDGFFLADASHGIPTFGSVSAESSPTIRGQFVRVFNYPDQTEQIAAELVRRWNTHQELVKALEVNEGDLVMLRRAIVEGDPKRELLFRIDDTLRETRSAFSLAKGEGE